MCNRAACGNPNDKGPWCNVCCMHYSTWAGHVTMYRHNHPTDPANLPDPEVPSE